MCAGCCGSVFRLRAREAKRRAVVCRRGAWLWRALVVVAAWVPRDCGKYGKRSACLSTSSCRRAVLDIMIPPPPPPGCPTPTNPSLDRPLPPCLHTSPSTLPVFAPASKSTSPNSATRPQPRPPTRRGLPSPAAASPTSPDNGACTVSPCRHRFLLADTTILQLNLHRRKKVRVRGAKEESGCTRNSKSVDPQHCQRNTCALPTRGG